MENERDSAGVFIPNKEIQGEFENAVEGSGWTEVTRLIRGSDELLRATWDGQEE